MPRNWSTSIVLPALIEKFEVRDRLPGCGNVIGLAWLVVRLGLRRHIDLINHASGLCDSQPGANVVSRVEFAGNTRLGQLVGHDHSAHKAGDSLRIDRNHPFSRIGANHYSPELVGCLLGRDGVGLLIPS